MQHLPAEDMRSNIGTWAVPSNQLPAIAKRMTDLFGTEAFDPTFLGQKLKTVYFDTHDFALRKARARSSD